MEPTTSQSFYSSKLQLLQSRISPIPQDIGDIIQNHDSNIKFSLGNKKFASVSEFRDQVYLHLRVFEDNIPTKKGIALCPTRAKTLLEAVHFIDGEAEYVWNLSQTVTKDSQKREYLLHLGFGTYLKVYIFNNRKYYDIRRYWKPENEIAPTKTGLCLNELEFQQLRIAAQDITNCIPSLLDVQHCECWFKDTIQPCSRCFPFL